MSRSLWILLLLGGCSQNPPPAPVPPTPTSVTAPVSGTTASVPAPDPDRPAFCEGYALLLDIESRRATLLAGAADARTEREGALRALSEEFGDHPAGVAQGIDTLLRSPLDPAVVSDADRIAESLESIRGYVGPICAE